MKKIIIALIALVALTLIAIRLWNVSVLADGYVGDGQTVFAEWQVHTEERTHLAVLKASSNGTIALQLDGEQTLMTHRVNLWTQPIDRTKEVTRATLVLFTHSLFLPYTDSIDSPAPDPDPDPAESTPTPTPVPDPDPESTPTPTPTPDRPIGDEQLLEGTVTA